MGCHFAVASKLGELQCFKDDAPRQSIINRLKPKGLSDAAWDGAETWQATSPGQELSIEG